MCLYIFSIPFIIFALLFSLLVVTQIRGHIAGSSLLPTTVRALHFYREKISALPSSTRVKQIKQDKLLLSSIEQAHLRLIM